MKNNEIINLIVDSLNLNDDDVKKILELSDLDISYSKFTMQLDESFEDEECDNVTLEGFLNGLIVLKRGPKENADGKPSKAPLAITTRKSINNVVLKKLKIALALSNDDIIDIYDNVFERVSKNDLTTYFRKQGHKHYRICVDHYLIKFLEGVKEGQ